MKKILTTITILFINFILIFSTLVYAENEENNKNEVKIGDTTYLKIDDAYADILKKTKESNSNEEITYATTDINNDNTPELIVCVGNSEAEKELFFYTYQSNKVVYLGKLSGGHTSLYEMNGKSYIMAVYGHMNNEIVYNISIESKKIKETKISDKTISDGEEYTEGDKLIEFKDYKTTNNQDNKQSNEQQNESKQEENKIDTTTKSGKLPQTGENTIYVILSVIALIAINILLLIKNKKIK